MKKQFAIAALTFGAIVLGTNNVQAQDTTTAETKATIELADIISINAENKKDVAFIYNTAQAYNEDQSVTEATTLTVTSSQKFSVNVNAGGTEFINDLGGAIPVEVLKIKAAAVKGKEGTGYVELSQGGGNLVENSPRGSELQWKLDYSIPKEKSSSNDILGKPKGIYKQTVYFTVTQ